jgi:hypothetical protein
MVLFEFGTVGAILVTAICDQRLPPAKSATTPEIARAQHPQTTVELSAQRGIVKCDRAVQ